MSAFISFAQNWEDVMLWRALKDVEQGFYVDLGAWSPDFDSVTKAFYERGWRGINVEPNPEFHRRLVEKRPHDINLQVAVSDYEGEAQFQILSNPGLSTMDAEIAKMHEDSGWDSSELTVSVIPLGVLWEKHVPESQPVHFLKIDVEGAEADIIRPTDWSAIRPWVIVVEATLPMSQQENHSAWESSLLDADYQFVYADGLNRFYLAKEHSNRKASFNYPPNFFDNFLRADTVHLQESAAETRQELEQAEHRIRALNEELYEKTQDKLQLSARLEAAESREGREVARADRMESRFEQAEAWARKESDRASRVADRLKDAEAQARKESERANRTESRHQEAEAQARTQSERAELAQASLQKVKDRFEEASARADAALRDLQTSRAAEVALTKRASEVAQHLAQREAELCELHTERNDLETRLNQSLAKAHQWWLMASGHEGQIAALKSSWSWRLMAPARWIADSLSPALRLPERILVWLFSPLLNSALRFILKRPRLRALLSKDLQKLPWLYWRLFNHGKSAGLPVTGAPAPSDAELESPAKDKVSSPEDIEEPNESLKFEPETRSVDDILTRIRAELKEKN